MRITADAVKLAKKFIRSEPMPRSLMQQLHRNGMEHLTQDILCRTAELILDNQDATPEKRRHLSQVLPCIAVFEILTVETGSRAKAFSLYEKWCLLHVQKMARALPALLKIPGLYRQVPRLMAKLLKQAFGEKAGFQFQNLNTKNGFSVDITACPYVQMCKKYDCLEIARFFCESDDLCFGTLHPKLVWNRTRTLATGGDRCDFQLYFDDEKQRTD